MEAEGTLGFTLHVLISHQVSRKIILELSGTIYVVCSVHWQGCLPFLLLSRKNTFPRNFTEHFSCISLSCIWSPVFLSVEWQRECNCLRLITPSTIHYFGSKIYRESYMSLKKVEIFHL